MTIIGSEQETEHVLPSRYRLEKVLGDGAAGRVYLVRDLERDEKLVALKVLTNQQAFDEHTVERFCEEIEASKELSHPNLIRAFDYVPLEHTMGYTMEYVEGEDLSRVLRSGRKLSADDVISILRQLLDALESLHERGIVHRDIKLENVILRPDGRVKLSDLGLMKKLGQSGLTKTGMLLGTAQYMPPEYVKDGDYGMAGDIYALGILIVELFAGRRRLQGKLAADALEELLKTKFAIPHAMLEDVPRMYRELLKKATSVAPRERFRTAQEMRHALEDLDRGPRLRPSLKHEVRSEHFGRLGIVSPSIKSFSGRQKRNYILLFGVLLGILFGAILSR